MKKIFLGISIFVLFLFVGICLAADDFAVSENDFDQVEKRFQFLVNDNRTSGQSPDEAFVTIDGAELSDVSIKSYGSSDLPVTFVFVVDNTSTAYSDQKNRPSEIAEAISSARAGKNDQYYLISFDTEVHAPEGPSKYPADVLDKLTYSAVGMSDFSDALLKAVDLLKGESSFGKKVIILISDGFQINNPRMQQGELADELAAAGYPVYSCGLQRSESQRYEESDLKKLSNISQATGGVFYSYESNKTPGKDIVSHIGKSFVISGKLVDEYTNENPGEKDASIQLKRNGNELSVLNTKVFVPIIHPISPNPDNPEDFCQLNPDDPSCKKTFNLFSWLQDHLGSNWLLIIIAGCLMIAVIILIILLISKRNKGEKFEEVDSEPENVPDSELIEDVKTNEEKTEAMPEGHKVQIVLDDLTTRKRMTGVIREGENKVFGRLDNHNPDNGVVVISADDTFISRNQFMISVSGGKPLIKDLGSTNGTYLNGEKIVGEVVLQSGSRIRIGDKPGEREFNVRVS